LAELERPSSGIGVTSGVIHRHERGQPGSRRQRAAPDRVQCVCQVFALQTVDAVDMPKYPAGTGAEHPHHANGQDRYTGDSDVPNDLAQ
jgi:hypothetical protein